MVGFASFLIRLVGYAVVFGVATRIAEYFWVRDGLDGLDQLQNWHDEGITAMTVAPVVVALLSLVSPRIALFLAFIAIGAALSAPFAFARMMQ